MDSAQSNAVHGSSANSTGVSPSLLCCVQTLSRWVKWKYDLQQLKICLIYTLYL